MGGTKRKRTGGQRSLRRESSPDTSVKKSVGTLVARSMTEFLARAFRMRPEVIWCFERFMKKLIKDPVAREQTGKGYGFWYEHGNLFTWERVTWAICNHAADDEPAWFGLTKDEGHCIRAWLNNQWFRDLNAYHFPKTRPRLDEVVDARKLALHELRKHFSWKELRSFCAFPPHYRIVR